MIYLIHTIDKLFEYYDESEFNFLNFRVKDNVYWFMSNEDIDIIINKFIIEEKREIIVLNKLVYFYGDVYYININNKDIYILNNDKIYYFDIFILGFLVNDIISIDELFINCLNVYKSWHFKIKLKEIGLLDIVYSENNFINYLSKIDMEYYLLYHYKNINNINIENKYIIENKYNNPYENILLVEEYLNRVEIYNIDIDKCEEYDLKYDKLPAKYNYSGFYSTTGRIFCNSEKWTSIQNINKNKRDILYADKDCYLIEFDYKSFEFNLLCQLIGIEEILDDPHIYTYNNLIGIEEYRTFEERRKIGKNINYSIIYGMSENKIVDYIINEFNDNNKLNKEIIIEKINNWEFIKKVKIFEKELINKINNNKILNYFGRNIHLKKDYAVLNNYISSIAADILYNKFLLIIDLLKNYNTNKNKIILQQFDSILIQLEEKNIENTNLFENIIDIFNEDINNLNNKIEFKYGKDWKNVI